MPADASAVQSTDGRPALPPTPQESAAFANLLLDSMSEGVYVIDRAGRMTTCNAAMLRMLGFEAAEMAGLSIHELIHHSHADGTAYPVEDCPIYRAARDGISMVVDREVFFRRDGTALPVEYRTEPLIREGRLEGAICTFVDITARLAGERQLRESEARLDLATQAGGIGIWDYHVAARTLRWDDRVRALFGLSPGRPIGMEASMAAVHEDDRARVEAAMAAAFDPAGDGVYNVRFRAIGMEDDVIRWVDARGRATFADGVAVRLLGTLRDVSADHAAEKHLRLLVNELNHRVKNSLAMVQGVAALTFRDGVDTATARSTFMERLVALSRAHDVLTAERWDGADLAQVVALTVQSHAEPDGDRFSVSGGSIRLSPKTALALSMALHELATNAVKYGALSTAAGRVRIDWAIAAGPQGERLHFRWLESGGPPVSEPRRRGFGSKLIERGLAKELEGVVRIEFRPQGVACVIDVPAPVADQGSAV